MSQYAHRSTSSIYWEKGKSKDKAVTGSFSQRLLAVNGDDDGSEPGTYENSYPAWKWPWLCIRPARGKNKFSFIYKGRARSLFTLLFWSFFAIVFVITSVCLTAQINNLPDAVDAAVSNGFSESRAYGDLQNLMQITRGGVEGNVDQFTGRYFGVNNNTLSGLDWLRAKLAAIDTFHDGNVTRSRGLNISLQDNAKGALNYGDPKKTSSAPYVIAYQHLTNLIVELPGRRRKEAICVNAHYDSTLFAPGASDNGAAVAVALEVLRVLSMRKPETRTYDFIALFNGAEESGLLGAHAFVTKHPWAKRCKAMINLDSAGGWGKEILFQTTPKHPWILKAYKEGAPHPLASVIAQDLFQTGLIPSGTDFQIFNDYTDYGVIDMAHYTNGYGYHTQLDAMFNYKAGTLQNTGDNVLGVVDYLNSNIKEFPGPKRSRPSDIFYDWFGEDMVTYSAKGAQIASSLVVAVALLSALAATLPFIHNHGAGAVVTDHVAPIILCTVFAALTIAGGIALNVGSALMYYKIKPLSYFRSWALVLFVYTPTSLLGQLLVQIALWWLLRQWRLASLADDLDTSDVSGRRAELYESINKDLNPEFDESENEAVNCCLRAHRQAPGDTQIGRRLFWGGILFWTTLLLVLTMKKIGAGFLAIYWVMFPLGAIAVGHTITWLLTGHASWKETARRWLCDPRDGSPWLIVCLLANVLPIALTLWTMLPLLVMFTPIVGRMGKSDAIPDVLLGAIVGIIYGLCTVFIWPFGQRAGNKFKLALALLGFWVVSLITVGASTQFDDLHPMRVDIIHGWHTTSPNVINNTLSAQDAPFDYSIPADQEPFLSLGAPNPGPVSKIADQIAGTDPFGMKTKTCSVPAYGYVMKDVPCFTLETGDPIPAPGIEKPNLHILSSQYDPKTKAWKMGVRIATTQSTIWQLYITGSLTQWSFPYPPSHFNKYRGFEGLGNRFLIVLRAGAPDHYDFELTFTGNPKVKFELTTNFIVETPIVESLLKVVPSYTQRWGKSNNVGPVLTMSEWNLELKA